MRIDTTVDVHRLDLTPLLALREPLLDEWAALQFDASGHVLDVETGQPRSELVRVTGPHRAPRAQYVVRLDDDTTVRAVVRADDGRRLAADVADGSGVWTADVDVTHHPTLHGHVLVSVDLTRALKADGLPGPAARFLGGPSLWRLTVAKSATVSLESSVGRRFTATGEATVTTSAARWRVHVRLDVRGRGLGRVAIALFGKRLRHGIEQWIARVTSEEAVARARRDLTDLAVSIDRAGGAAAFVRRAVWEPGFAWKA